MNSRVTLSYAALTTIIRHGMRFASNARPTMEWQECMGFLLGRDDTAKKSLFVSDAIPMSHGSLVEVRFDEEHYVQADSINQTLTDDNWVVGWYHTHPGHGLFLSDVDKINHAGYQSLRDTAIALVFDPSGLKPGADFRDYIRIFQLDDPEYLELSGFVEIKNVWVKSDFNAVVEALRETTEAAQRNAPFIMEYGEKR